MKKMYLAEKLYCSITEVQVLKETLHTVTIATESSAGLIPKTVRRVSDRWHYHYTWEEAKSWLVETGEVERSHYIGQLSRVERYIVKAKSLQP